MYAVLGGSKNSAGALLYGGRAADLWWLLRLQVVCDGSGLGSSWLLDTISVTAKSTGATTWFYAGRWLGHAAGLEAVLDGIDDDVRGQLVTYKVSVLQVQALQLCKDTLGDSVNG
jgi:hypothetical protein